MKFEAELGSQSGAGGINFAKTLDCKHCKKYNKYESVSEI